MSILIRRTIEADIPALAHIVSRNYTKETAEHFADEIAVSFAPSPYRPWFYTAVDGDRPVGCAGYGVSWLAYGVFSLFWVNVNLDRRGEGIGAALVSRCIEDLSSRATLIVLATSIPNFYYKKWGFETLTKFHGDQMTDTLMALNLEPAS